ncbi:MAG: class I SAM-dependent methyltransferase [Rhodothermia bacterium]|nr:class I SAM-dependent methyltransferase [Rhodothermia bacterium]
MKLLFKHEDTRAVALLVIVFVVVTALAAWIVPDASLHVAIGYAITVIVMMQLNLYRRSRLDAESDRIHQQDLLWLYSEGDFDAPLPPMTGWSAEPGLVALLQSLVLRDKPVNVVELGSGVSTIVIGYALRKVGRGSITSLDHDEVYANRTTREIEHHGLQRIATVQHKPLMTVRVGDEEWRWYGDARSTVSQPIDMLVVDGPPFATGKMARYPAVPIFLDLLTEDAVVVLHDLYRADEQRIVERWMAAFPEFKVFYIETPKRAAVLRRNISAVKEAEVTPARA